MINTLKVLAAAVIVASISDTALAQSASSRRGRQPQPDSTIRLEPSGSIPWISHPQESNNRERFLLGRPSTESAPASRYSAGVAEQRVPLLGEDDDGLQRRNGPPSTSAGGPEPAGPAWADRVITSAESAMTGMQRGTQRMRQGIRGVKGRQDSATRRLGRRYSESGTRLTRNGRWLGWIDKGSVIFRVLGSLTTDRPDLVGAGQDSANSLFAGMAAAAGARGGGLLGLQYGSAGGPWGAFSGAIVGTFAGAYFGAELYELTGQRLVDAGAEELVRQEGISKPLAVMRRSEKLILEAEGFLVGGELEWAGNSARQARHALQGVWQALEASGYGGEIRQLNARALAVLAKAPREKTPEELQREKEERQVVQTAQAAIGQAEAFIRRPDYLAARQAVDSGLGLVEILRRAGRTDLIEKLRSLDQFLIGKDREYGPQRKTQLAGSAPWTSDDGKTRGRIQVRINVESGEFMADFVGTSGSVAQVHISHRGTFNGKFTGDEHQGRLSGSGMIGTTLEGSTGSRPFGRSSYRANAHLQGGVVSGTVAGPSLSCSFRVPVE